jgi:hypothetical protein
MVGYYIAMGVLMLYTICFLIFFFWHTKSSEYVNTGEVSVNSDSNYNVARESGSSVLVTYLGKPLSIVAILHREFLFIPTSILLLTMFYCSATSPDGNPLTVVDQCQNEVHVVYMAVSALLLLCSLLLALASSMYYNDTQPDSALPWANCNTGLVLLKLLKKTIIIVCVVVSFKVGY